MAKLPEPITIKPRAKAASKGVATEPQISEKAAKKWLSKAQKATLAVRKQLFPEITDEHLWLRTPDKKSLFAPTIGRLRVSAIMSLYNDLPSAIKVRAPLITTTTEARTNEHCRD